MQIVRLAWILTDLLGADTSRLYLKIVVARGGREHLTEFFFDLNRGWLMCRNQIHHTISADSLRDILRCVTRVQQINIQAF